MRRNLFQSNVGKTDQLEDQQPYSKLKNTGCNGIVHLENHAQMLEYELNEKIYTKTLKCLTFLNKEQKS